MKTIKMITRMDVIGYADDAHRRAALRGVDVVPTRPRGGWLAMSAPLADRSQDDRFGTAAGARVGFASMPFIAMDHASGPAKGSGRTHTFLGETFIATSPSTTTDIRSARFGPSTG